MHARRGVATVILLHGLTATPHQFDLLAPLIHARGVNVIVPRLPRHGYRDKLTNALATLETRELIAAVKHAIADARELEGPVTVAGFSLGGLLAAYAAQREVTERAVCIAPFFGVCWLSRRLNGWADAVLRFTPDAFLWWDPIAREKHGEGDGYPRYPLSAVRKAFELRDALFEDAARRAPVTRSIVTLVNRKDTTCHNGLTRDLVQRWRANGARVEVRDVPDIGPSHDFMTPGHSLRRELEQERVYPVVVDVILG